MDVLTVGSTLKIGSAREDEVRNVVAENDVPNMFNITVLGDNATIVIGNGNAVKVLRGDFNALAMLLAEKGVSQKDLDELKTAITYDDGKLDDVSKSFGPAVKEWIAKMCGKAEDTSWQIGVDVAGGLLTEALKAYYF